MRTQQEAERAEQQRIKNLVLNYDLTDEQDGEAPSFHYIHTHGGKRTQLIGTGSLNRAFRPGDRGGDGDGDGSRSQHMTAGTMPHEMQEISKTPLTTALREVDGNTNQSTFADQTGSVENLHGGPRYDKAGNTRSKQRARKLQLGDIDWYAKKSSTPAASAPAPAQASLDDFIVDKSQSKKKIVLRQDSVRGGGSISDRRGPNKTTG